MASDPPKILLSYSHDSPEHQKRVLTLANRLRADGVDCVIDQYVVVPAAVGGTRSESRLTVRLQYRIFYLGFRQ